MADKSAAAANGRDWTNGGEPVTIWTGGVDVKKDTLWIEADESEAGKFLVTFTFDAISTGSITVVFFAKESEECCLTPTKESLLTPVIMQFKKGLLQKFRQPLGTGIDFSMFSEAELSKEGEINVYPLVVKAEVLLEKPNSSSENSGPDSQSTYSQLTQAVFKKGNDGYRIKAVKQILWVSGLTYELQNIYGLGKDPGKECIICLSEPLETVILPCRHYLCMCIGCAKVLMFETKRCPLCRQTVERLLELKVSNGAYDIGKTAFHNISKV